MLTEESRLQFIPGVGPRRAALLESELGVSNVGELLRVYPFRYVDRSGVRKISEIGSDSAYVQILGTVLSSELVGQGKARRLKALGFELQGEPAC